MSILDKLYNEIQKFSITKGIYPNRLILGVDVYSKLIIEIKERLALGFTTHPNGSHKRLWGVPIIIDCEDTHNIEIGYTERVKVGGKYGSK